MCTDVYLRLVHSAVSQRKLTQHCKATKLQFKRKLISDTVAVRMSSEILQKTKIKERFKKHLTQGQRTGILFTFGGLMIMAAALIECANYLKVQRVDKQVKAYEKTLPAEYLEYKQAVEHYRDSLMHAKGR